MTLSGHAAATTVDGGRAVPGRLHVRINNVVEVLSPEDWREEHDLRGDRNPRSGDSRLLLKPLYNVVGGIGWVFFFTLGG